MNQPNSTDDEALFANLRALEESTFPKHCGTCGRRYETAAEFATATSAIREDRSGFKQTYDEDGKPIVELFRNCVCGSTLMSDFHDRRDSSSSGGERRQRFDELLRQIRERGIDSVLARKEILKLMRGQKSEVLGQLLSGSAAD